MNHPLLGHEQPWRGPRARTPPMCSARLYPGARGGGGPEAARGDGGERRDRVGGAASRPGATPPRAARGGPPAPAGRAGAAGEQQREWRAEGGHRGWGAGGRGRVRGLASAGMVAPRGPRASRSAAGPPSRLGGPGGRIPGQPASCRSSPARWGRDVEGSLRGGRAADHLSARTRRRRNRQIDLVGALHEVGASRTPSDRTGRSFCHMSPPGSSAASRGPARLGSRLLGGRALLSQPRGPRRRRPPPRGALGVRRRHTSVGRAAGRVASLCAKREEQLRSPLLEVGWTP
jgi:hypothetical protein